MTNRHFRVRPEAIGAVQAGWWAGTDEEFMNLGGPFETREEAIAEGRHQQGGDPFWICQARLHRWYAPDASQVIDAMCEQGDDIFHEGDFSGLEGGDAAEAAAEDDLQTVLNEWAKRHAALLPEPTAFDVCAAREQIDAPVKLAAPLEDAAENSHG